MNVEKKAWRPWQWLLVGLSALAGWIVFAGQVDSAGYRVAEYLWPLNLLSLVVVPIFTSVKVLGAHTDSRWGSFFWLLGSAVSFIILVTIAAFLQPANMGQYVMIFISLAVGAIQVMAGAIYLMTRKA